MTGNIPRVVQDPTSQPEAEPKVALVHVLRPGFHNLDESSFDDIGEAVLERASPRSLREILIDDAGRSGRPVRRERQERNQLGRSQVWYRSGKDGRGVGLTLTAQEYLLLVRSVPALGAVAYNGVIVARDAHLQKETGDPNALARTDQDLATARRGAVRQVMGKIPHMEAYLAEQIQPRREMTDRFIEMTINPNLIRGTDESVRKRFEYLRTFVFGHMLDAVRNNKQWTEKQAERAERILQKKLYIAGSGTDRVHNFRAMLELARDYYGHKWAFIMTRIQESNEYLRDNQQVVDEIIALDKQREEEKARKQSA